MPCYILTVLGMTFNTSSLNREAWSCRSFSCLKLEWLLCNSATASWGKVLGQKLLIWPLIWSWAFPLHNSESQRSVESTGSTLPSLVSSAVPVQSPWLLFVIPPVSGAWRHFVSLFQSIPVPALGWILAGYFSIDLLSSALTGSFGWSHAPAILWRDGFLLQI